MPSAPPNAARSPSVSRQPVSMLCGCHSGKPSVQRSNGPPASIARRYSSPCSVNGPLDALTSIRSPASATIGGVQTVGVHLPVRAAVVAAAQADGRGREHELGPLGMGAHLVDVGV